jgi:uncharacterized protein YdgA (DUF945 family)
MNKAAGVVVGVVVVAGIAWTGASWYTGTQVESKLQESIAKVNEQLKTLAPGSNASLALASFERGVFSSTAHYSLKVPRKEAKDGAAAETAEFLVNDHIEHGPFPLGNLKAGHFGPVMASSHAQLEKNDTVAAWFAATKGQAPITSDLSLAYGGNVDGRVQLAPAEYASGSDSLKFSGLTLNVDARNGGESAKVTGTMDSLVIGGKEADADKLTQFTVAGMNLDSDMKMGPSKLYTGKNTLTLKQIDVAATGEPPVVVKDYSQRIDVDETGGKFGGTVVYSVGMVNVAGKDVAGGQFAFNAKNLDPAAIKTLSDTYSKMVMRSMREGHATDGSGLTPTPEEKQQLQTSLETVLAGNPTFTIDPLLVKTDKGEARFTLVLDLAKPGQPNLPVEEAVAQTIRKLDARLQVAKPMVAGLVAQSMTQPGQDATAALQQATAQAEMMGGMAVQMGVAKIEGDNLVATLNYANGQVDFNGKKMPAAQFAQSVMGMVLGGGRGFGQ